MLLEAKNIKMNFIRKRNQTNILEVINDLNLEINQGQIIIIKGESGKGKTTIINILSGLLKPVSGNVLYNDIDIYSLNDKKLSELRFNNFGIIPQGQTLLKGLSVIDNILLPLKLYRSIKDSDINKAKELLTLVGISDLENVLPKEMSGGELRRASIARSLINDPKIIFADEPTNDLDKKNRMQVIEIFKNCRQNGISIIMVTHDDSILDIGDKIIDLD